MIHGVSHGILAHWSVGPDFTWSHPRLASGQGVEFKGQLGLVTQELHRLG